MCAIPKAVRWLSGGVAILALALASLLYLMLCKRKKPKNEWLSFRKAVEASGEVIFLTDREGVITYINPAFTKLYGYYAEEVVGKTTPRILKSGVMTEQDYEHFWETLLGAGVIRGEFINKCKDGRLVTIEGSANPILDERGNISGFLAIQRDVTESKQAREELKSAHVYQQSIIDGVAEPIMVIDTDYHVKLMNRAARRFSHRSVELSEPLFCYQVSHQRDTPCNGKEHPCPLHEASELNQTVTAVHEHYQADGEIRLVEVIAAPFFDTEGNLQGIIESMRDITEHKRAEEALLQYADRLRALAAQLAEVEEAERQRLSQELHDQVGQNLTALSLNLNIVRSLIPEEAEEVHNRIEDSLSLVDQTTEKIRDVMANLRPPVLDDYGLVAALRWYAEQFTKRTDIAVTVEGNEPDPRLPQRIESALFRIAQEALTNVAKHAEASHAAVCVEVEDDIMRLVVADDGIGFDPTQQGENGEGQGWGLLTMTERAEAVGAHCQIESYPDRGTKIILEIGL